MTLRIFKAMLSLNFLLYLANVLNSNKRTELMKLHLAFARGINIRHEFSEEPFLRIFIAAFVDICEELFRSKFQ